VAIRWQVWLALVLGCEGGGGGQETADATETSGTSSADASSSDDDDTSTEESDGSDDDSESESGSEGSDDTGGVAEWPEYDANPFEFELAFPVPIGMARGSIFVHEIDGDGLYDFVVTGLDNIAVYDHWGVLLWHDTPAIHLPEAANGGYGYPGLHAPGAIAGDVDDDGQAEIAFLTNDGVIEIRDARTGELENGDALAAFAFPGAEAIAIANFRGLGDRDAIVQYSQWELRAIELDGGTTLWHVTDWNGIEHSMARVVDVDGDGLDEVVGPIFLGADGARLNAWDLEIDRGTLLAGLDSMSIADVVPGLPLEIVIAETAPDESGIGLQSGEAIVVNHEAILWGTTRPSRDIPPTGQCEREKDPDKLAVGDFDPARAGLEVMARSACARHPWVMDSTGAIVATWNVSDTAPKGWYLGGGALPDSEGGIDSISPIQWEAEGAQSVLLKERHIDGKAAIVDPMTGAFLAVFEVTAARPHAADIAGDYREEAIVVEASDAGMGRVKVFWNATPNPTPDAQPRRWTMQHYRRIKQNYNYYSP
jgi:hypothetical protein